MAEIVAMARATPATTGVCLVSISLAVLQVCGARWDVSPGWLVLRPWTLVTATLVEPTLWHLLITLPLLMLMARYFETRWGSRSLLNMLAITAIGVNLCMCLLVLIVYISTSSYSLRREELLFDTPVGGMSGILPAFIVCFKQVVPQHKLTLLNLKLRVKQLPSALLLVHLVLAIFGLVRKRFLAMHMFGVVISWVYLRFYKLFQGSRGDSSETFSFTSFFPARWSGAIKPISTFVYTNMVKRGLLPALPPRIVSVLDRMESGGVDSVPAPVIAPDAERRRLLALKELDDRLAQS